MIDIINHLVYNINCNNLWEKNYDNFRTNTSFMRKDRC